MLRNFPKHLELETHAYLLSDITDDRFYKKNPKRLIILETIIIKTLVLLFLLKICFYLKVCALATHLNISMIIDIK